jgi:hypothetical protein
LARNFASFSGAGGFCIPLDLSNTGISGVSDGANVTIQLVYNGGDGNLYQVSLRVPDRLSHMTCMTEFRFFHAVLRLDTGAKLYHPIQCLLYQFYQQEWR